MKTILLPLLLVSGLMSCDREEAKPERPKNAEAQIRRVSATIENTSQPKDVENCGFLVLDGLIFIQEGAQLNAQIDSIADGRGSGYVFTTRYPITDLASLKKALSERDRARKLVKEDMKKSREVFGRPSTKTKSTNLMPEYGE